jgi:hypothetical protein
MLQLRDLAPGRMKSTREAIGTLRLESAFNSDKLSMAADGRGVIR